MSVCQFIQRLLNIKGFSVKGYTFRNWFKELWLEVKPYKNGALCPHCSRRGKIIHTVDLPRAWRDIPVCGRLVFFVYSPREIICRTHGRVQECIPWAAPHSRVTYRFEYSLLVYCSTMTQKAAAQFLKISQSTISDLLHRIITKTREGHKVRNLKMMGVDEISYCKGHKYATIVYDLERSCVVWIGKGKAKETIESFFSNELSHFQRKRIVSACCDMSETFIGAIEKWCPNATLVLDRFHIVKSLNEAVDEVRKEEWREASKDDKKALKGLRWLLYRHSSKRSEEDTKSLRSLYMGNRRIHRAWILKDEFEQFWDFKDQDSAKEFLDGWYKIANKSRLESIKKFVKTIKKHEHRLLPFVETRLTNAVSEGINRIIKIIKNRASGFRNLDAFSDLIFLTVGDLDIPAQIPAKFHAL
ncbi:MAG: ISL3 family transposase [Desulfobacterales bacterium]